MNWIKHLWKKYKDRQEEIAAERADSTLQMTNLLVGILSRLPEEDLQTIKKFIAVWRPYLHE